MTEGEWLTCDNPRAMLTHLGACYDPGPVSEPGHRPSRCRVSDRRLRLFACAYFRSLPPRHGNWHELVDAVGWGERVADGLSLDEVPNGARRWQPCSTSGESSASWVKADVEGDPEAKRCASHLLRDIVGNPWRPVRVSRSGRLTADVLRAQGSVYGCCRRHADRMACDCLELAGDVLPGWLTPQVASLARAAYDERNEDGTLDAARLAVLSDALEEAGCRERRLLDHLRKQELCPACEGAGQLELSGGRSFSRTPDGVAVRVEVYRDCPSCEAGWRAAGPCVRGCWALDLILGRE